MTVHCLVCTLPFCSLTQHTGHMKGVDNIWVITSSKGPQVAHTQVSQNKHTKDTEIIFTVSAPRPIQSISRRLHLLCVVVYPFLETTLPDGLGTFGRRAYC